MNRIIADASVAVKWVLAEPRYDAARRMLNGDDELWAPDILIAESANALFKHVRRRELSEPDALEALDALLALPLRLESATFHVPAAMRLALELEHPVYDCIYLAMAVLRDALVVTDDRRFLNACRRGGYEAHVRPLT